MLVGGPNAGKSAILAALTNARPEVAAYPFTTRAPYPGMMAWEDVRLQLVDLPPVTADFFEPWVPDVVRSADAAPARRRPGRRRPDRRRRGRPRPAGRRPTPSWSGSCPSTSRTRRSTTSRRCSSPTRPTPTGRGDRLDVLREWSGPRFPILAVSAVRRAGSGRPPSRLVRSTRSDPDLHEGPWQAGRSVEAVHRPDRQHGPRPRPGDPPRLRAFAEVRQGLGVGRLRGPDGQTRPRTPRRRRRRVARPEAGRRASVAVRRAARAILRRPLADRCTPARAGKRTSPDGSGGRMANVPARRPSGF